MPTCLSRPVLFRLRLRDRRRLPWAGVHPRVHLEGHRVDHRDHQAPPVARLRSASPCASATGRATQSSRDVPEAALRGRTCRSCSCMSAFVTVLTPIPLPRAPSQTRHPRCVRRQLSASFHQAESWTSDAGNENLGLRPRDGLPLRLKLRRLTWHRAARSEPEADTASSGCNPSCLKRLSVLVLLSSSMLHAACTWYMPHPTSCILHSTHHITHTICHMLHATCHMLHAISYILHA